MASALPSAAWCRALFTSLASLEHMLFGVGRPLWMFLWWCFSVVSVLLLLLLRVVAGAGQALPALSAYMY